jgi:protein TonB
MWMMAKSHKVTIVGIVFLMGAIVARIGAQAAPIYQPGNGVTIPRVISEVQPVYTEEAKAARIEGTVILNTVVLADGRVGDVDVAVSLDAVHGLDQAAIDAMRRWQFEPGKKDGQPVAVRVHVEMNFTLR